ncbi:TlpA disulfide reductase family protein [Halorubrum ezzemoulense]|uniref:TlpA family protein disulfide reductase n=1 Tax=Halorubrum ezzemoulense TaxID=337243 RepID=UPI00232B0613|nr:TlpA disulfide reductase family protein [Halorubrum ezzemoulense]MDB9249802.1 TlpA disulfide reductase family protein [Halorubrum ezzemoulense]MDB9259841.1 TlpA disulfide reductase family protein [Halorubrum ezzemoulense]MDB9263306.1 TlpA disulfide reductase family protein [Halorubrum ezzemoulense]MDB9266847.1 TlpA disulfide reductase family protein [Halorubrum ezzemoulense]MDB9270202.1 TlpA disulfide reductase family protein [Halorubrum ezzemoulense]
MRRRHLLAGLASVGVLGGAGAVATGGVPDALGGSDAPELVEPITLDTVDAPGSRDGEVTLPAPDRPTFVDFFGTWCPPCAEQMPALAEAHDRIGDEVLFVSVTTEPVGEAVSEERVADWWRENDGDWLVAADVSAELAARLNVGSYPSARAVDASGRVRWATSGTHTTEEFIEGIRQALDG